MVHDFTIFSLPQHFRFAQFFISPLLKEDTVEREIQAVDSGKWEPSMQERTIVFCFCFSLAQHRSVTIINSYKLTGS